jgi:hypothetical protein
MKKILAVYYSIGAVAQIIDNFCGPLINAGHL